jgi:hypothetical protein
MILLMKGTLTALAIIVAWFMFMYLGTSCDPFIKSEPCARAAQLRNYIKADRERLKWDRLEVKKKDVEVEQYSLSVSPEQARQHPQEIQKRIGDIETPAEARLAEDEGTVGREEKELSIVEAACREESPAQGRP